LQWIGISSLWTRGAVAAWTPESVGWGGTVVMVLFTVIVYVMSIRSFENKLREGKMPSKERSRLYSRVLGWLVLAIIAASLIWYFNEPISERLPRLR
jgi:hypothetical protein